MIKTAIITALTAMALSACGGGGGGDSNSAPTAKPALTLSFYGLPLKGTQSTAHAAIIRAAASDTTASAPSGTSDSTDTVQSLESALAAQGVTANVTAQVMDGTTLHGIVMGENNGLPPTPDQFGKDPSEWLIVNFQLDDMVTPWTDPNQQAAVSQFANDLAVFVNRAHVSGKQVFVVAPIQPCASVPSSDAYYGLTSAMVQAGNSALMYTVGTLSNTLSTPDSMGADCRTPSTAMLNLRTQQVAIDVAARYKASTATAASAPVAASQ